jgi:hypothetical protein
MNGRKAKLIRKLVYKAQDPRSREYKQLKEGQVLSDLHRSVYQEMKKECQKMTLREVKENLKERSQ